MKKAQSSYKINTKIMRYVFFTFMALVSFHAMAKTEVTLSSAIVNFGESVQLTITRDNNDGNAPDVSVLQKDFDIINRSQATNIQLTNGALLRSYVWRYDLQPKRTGKLMIPAISIGNEKTNPLELVVNVPSDKNQDFVLLSEVDTNTQYVGGQIIYSLKLLYRSWLNGQFNLPKMPGLNQVTLGENKRYNTVYNNQSYQVVEWKYALTPSQSGAFEIGASQFNGRSRTSGLRLDSKPIAIRVLPQPADWPQNTPWLAARSVRLWDEWEPRSSNWFVGESISRVIHLEVEGVSPEQLGNIDWSLPEGLKIYPENPQRKSNNTPNSLRSTLSQKWVIIPETPQTFDLSEIELVWWDITNSTRVTTKLKSRQINVEAASLSPTFNDEHTVIINNTVIEDSTPNTNVEVGATAELVSSSATWLAMGLGWSGWVMAIALWMRRKKTDIDKDSKQNTLDEDRLLKEIKLACKKHDGSKAYHLSLMWLRKNGLLIDPDAVKEIERYLTDLSAQLISKEDASTLDKPLDELSALLTSSSAQITAKQPISKIPKLYG